ncbi:hypothetical protein HRbin08_01916 [bacterium HR08]|nr:hypothetical protein HRbin08_01916 [bacterium HR08]
MRRGIWIGLAWIFGLIGSLQRGTPPTLAPQAVSCFNSVCQIAHIPGPPTRALAAVGHILYAGMDRKVVVIDLTDPARPILQGESPELPGIVTGLTIVGTVVYATVEGAGLYVLDFRLPASPRILGSVDTPGKAHSVAISEAYAYVADGDAGLRVIDVSNLASPREVGFYDTPGIAYSVVISGAYAYIADGFDGIWVIDVSNPAAPQEVTTVSTPQPARNLRLMGSYMVVALGWEWGWDPQFDEPDLLLLDLSNPSSPQVVSRFRMAGSGQAVAVEGPWIYLATTEGVGGIRAASSPASLLGWWRWASSGAVGLAAQNGYVFVALASGNTGVAILRHGAWGDAPVLTPIGQFGGRAWQVVHQGSQIYLAVRPFKVWRVDGSDPAQLRETGQRLLPGIVWDLLVSGDRLYIAAGRAGLRILDAANPSLQEIGEVDTPGEAVGLAAMPPYILVADGPGGLRVIDSSDPQNPQEIARWPEETDADIREVAVSGAFAYLLIGSRAIQVLDLSSPSAPHPRGVYTMWGARSLSISGNYLYVTAGNTLSILDISDPDRLRIVGSIALGSGWLWDVKASGDRAYVAGDGLHVVDVSNPSAPRLLGTFQTEAYGVDPAGPLAYVAAGGALRAIRVEDPSSMTEVGTLRMGALALGGGAMAVSHGVLYITGGDLFYSPASDRMTIVDARDLDHPRRLAEYRPDWSRCAALSSPQPSISLPAVDGGLVFFTSSCFFHSEFRQFEVVEASDPADPLPADFMSLDAYAEDLLARLPFVYIADGEDLWVMDLSSPSIKGKRLSTPGKAMRLAMAGSRLYLADGPSGLRIMDLSRPADPVELGSYSWDAGEARAVLADGRFAYVLLQRMNGGIHWDLRILDLAQPHAPQELTVYPLSVESERSFAQAGHYVFVAERHATDRTLRVINVEDPSSPREVESWPELSGVAIVGEGDRLYVLDREGHLVVFRLPHVSPPEGPYRVYLPMIARSDPIDFSIAQAEVLQGTAMSPPYTVFIAGRSTIVRAVPVVQGALYRRVTGRLTCYWGDSPIATVERQAVARPFAEAAAFGRDLGSLSFKLPEGCREPGSSFIVELDPGNQVPETNEGNNRSPASGRHMLDFQISSPMRVMIVPVRYQGALPPGAEDLSRLDYLTWFPVRIFPVSSVEYSLHSPVDFDDGGCTGSDCWRRLLDQITAIHDQEPQGAGMIYYGLVDAVWGGIAGIGWLGRPTSVGWAGWPDDRPQASLVAAHEMGHNFNRLHAPGCGADYVDPNFPSAYLDPAGRATIGVWGLDLWEMRWKPPWEYYDLMSYCHPQWISDYTYRAIFDFRRSAGFAPIPSAPWGKVLYLRGWIDPQGQVFLRPAYTLEAPLEAEASGPFRVELLGADGSLLATRRFAPTIIPDDPERWQGFTLRMPAVPEAATLRIYHGERLIAEQRVKGPPPSLESLQLRPEPSGAITLLAVPRPGLWHRVRISRDGGRTWEVIVVDSAELHATMELPDCGMLIEVQVSDGLRTDTRTFTGCETPPLERPQNP